ncbi:hypothetical protein BH09BAC1_BH09BAC1_26660 [soil metagenome]
MKNFTIALVMLFLLLGADGFHTTSAVTVTISNPQSNKVLICESKGSYAYHSHTCQGLAKCIHNVAKVSVDEAKRRGYRPCGYCY